MTLRRQLLGRPPSWPEIAVAAAVTVLVLPLKLIEPAVSSWPGATLGFVLGGLVVGPYTGSRLHGRVADWFESASVGWRWGVRLAVIAALVAIGALVLSADLTISLTEGLLFGMATVHWLQMLAFRTIVDHTAV